MRARLSLRHFGSETSNEQILRERLSIEARSFDQLVKEHIGLGAHHSLTGSGSNAT